MLLLSNAGLRIAAMRELHMAICCRRWGFGDCDNERQGAVKGAVLNIDDDKRRAGSL